MTPTQLDLITVAQAARQADRSDTAIRRWITDGWIPTEAVFVTPGRNGAWLIDRKEFEKRLPTLLAEMGNRKGGRGHLATDAHGNFRVNA